MCIIFGITQFNNTGGKTYTKVDNLYDLPDPVQKKETGYYTKTYSLEIILSSEQYFIIYLLFSLQIIIHTTPLKYNTKLNKKPPN